jgi:drug/metabolite transporter (DMT)-like permease
MTRLTGLTGIVIISFSAIFVRLADVSPTTAAFFRAAYAVPALFLVWAVIRHQDRREARARWLAFGSGIFLAVDLSFWHEAIALIGAGLATVLGNTQVVFVGVAAWVLHKERPNRLALLTIPVVFVGVGLISGLGRPGAYGDDPVAGVLYGLLTGVFFGVFILVFRASNRGLAPVAGPLFEATCGMAVGTAVASIFDPDFSLTPAWPAHGWLVALALGSQVIGWLFISHALPRLAAIETSVQLLVQPMLTMLWGRLIFGEYLSGLQWAGVALVLGGVGLLSIRGTVDQRSLEPSVSPVAADVKL